MLNLGFVLFCLSGFFFPPLKFAVIPVLKWDLFYDFIFSGIIKFVSLEYEFILYLYWSSHLYILGVNWKNWEIRNRIIILKDYVPYSKTKSKVVRKSWKIWRNYKTIPAALGLSLLTKIIKYFREGGKLSNSPQVFLCACTCAYMCTCISYAFVFLEPSLPLSSSSVV